MNLYILIFGLAVCSLATSLFLYVRVNKGGIAGLFTKIFASFCFVLFAILLSATKMNVAFYGSFAVAFLVLGLVCGLIGDTLLDLKVIYPFHENKFLPAGMTSFGVGHIFYLLAVVFFVNTNSMFFAWELLKFFLIIFGLTLVLTLIMWFVSKKFLKLDYGKFTWIINAYTFILLLVTLSSLFFGIFLKNYLLVLLGVGFVLFLISDLILSKQYFGGKQDDKTLVFVNHLTYYAAQILIATCIYFV